MNLLKIVNSAEVEQLIFNRVSLKQNQSRFSSWILIAAGANNYELNCQNKN